MCPNLTKSSKKLRIELATALGFPEYPSNTSAEPYLIYIDKQNVRKKPWENYYKLFMEVIRHAKDGSVPTDGTPRSDRIQVLLDKFVSSETEELFADTSPGEAMRQVQVEETIMCILGAWTMMSSSFQLSTSFGPVHKHRKIITAYTNCAKVASKPYEDNLAGLIKGSNLVPTLRFGDDTESSVQSDTVMHIAMRLVSIISQFDNQEPRLFLDPFLPNSMNTGMPGNHTLRSSVEDPESQSVEKTRLNAFTLKVLGAVDICWTYNISRHMLLTKRGRRYQLEIFALPCIFEAQTITSEAVGISSVFCQELEESYGTLFNAWPVVPRHARLGWLFGIRSICWCWSCSAHRYREKLISDRKDLCGSRSRKFRSSSNTTQSEFDPRLEQFMKIKAPSDWASENFPCLWPRIVLLEQHLQTSRPWSVWVLFRDRRDTLQFWTFLFGTLVVVLTMFQVFLGIAQVVGAFNK